MRIICGKYGKRRFSIPKNFRARPTTDFAKENVFNVLENFIDWETLNALDLFSGTGSIGFELLSRGCKRVVSIEKNANHYAFIKKTAKELNDPNFFSIKGDAFTYIENASDQFDLIFADPPYDLPELKQIPELIFQSALLNIGGIFILEHPKAYSFSEHAYFLQHRAYGSVNFTLFQKPE